MDREIAAPVRSQVVNASSLPKSNEFVRENAVTETPVGHTRSTSVDKCRRDLKTLSGKALKIAYKAEYKAWTNSKSRSSALSIVEGPAWGPMFNTFPGFLAHVGPRPRSDHSLDRIDPDYGYVEGNVRWASKQLQSENRGIVDVIEVDGQPMLRSELANRLGISRDALRMRMKRGKSADQLLAEHRGESPGAPSEKARQVEDCPWHEGKEKDWEACFQTERRRLLPFGQQQSRTAFFVAKCAEERTRLNNDGLSFAEQNGPDAQLPAEFRKKFDYWDSLWRFAVSQRGIVEQALGPVPYDVAPTEEELDEVQEHLYPDSLTDEEIWRSD